MDAHCGPGTVFYLVDRVRRTDAGTEVTDAEVNDYMAGHGLSRKYVTRAGEKRHPGETHIKSIVSDMLDELLGVQRTESPPVTTPATVVVLERLEGERKQPCCSS